MEDTENLHTLISGSVENTVGFYGVLKIMITVGIEAHAQLRIGRQLFEGLLNVDNILLGTRKAKLLSTVIKNTFQIADRLFVNLKDRIIRYYAFFSSWKRSP